MILSLIFQKADTSNDDSQLYKDLQITPDNSDRDEASDGDADDDMMEVKGLYDGK